MLDCGHTLVQIFTNVLLGCWQDLRCAEVNDKDRNKTEHMEYNRNDCGSWLKQPLRFSAARKPQFSVCGSAQNDKFEGYFHSSSSRSLSVKTHYLASILTDTFVEGICRNVSCAQGKRSLHSRWNFHRVTRPWQGKWRQIRISTDKRKWRQYVFPQCRLNNISEYRTAIQNRTELFQDRTGHTAGHVIYEFNRRKALRLEAQCAINARAAEKTI